MLMLWMIFADSFSVWPFKRRNEPSWWIFKGEEAVISFRILFSTAISKPGKIFLLAYCIEENPVLWRMRKKLIYVWILCYFSVPSEEATLSQQAPACVNSQFLSLLPPALTAVQIRVTSQTSKWWLLKLWYLLLCQGRLRSGMPFKPLHLVTLLRPFFLITITMIVHTAGCSPGRSVLF